MIKPNLIFFGMNMKIDSLIWAWISGYGMGLMVCAIIRDEILLALAFLMFSLGAIRQSLKNLRR